MDETLVFVDETGDPKVGGKRGSSHLFAIAALIVDGSVVPLLREFVKSARKEYAPTKQELKFSDLSNKARKAIFKELAKYDFSFYGIVANKPRITCPGLIYSSIFYKVFFGKLVKTIAQRYASIDLYFDAYGDSKFQESLKKYVRRKYRQKGLFEDRVFLGQDSQVCELTQIADLLVGAIGRAAGVHGRPCDYSYISLLSRQYHGIKHWPPYLRAASIEEDLKNENDHALEQESERRVRYFLEKNDSTGDVKVNAQIAVAESLLYSKNFLTGEELVNLLEEMDIYPEGISMEEKRRWVQKYVIRVLRDTELLVTSRSGILQSGYKLIRTCSEAGEFVVTNYKRMAAMGRRASSVTKAVKNVSGGEIDLLSQLSIEVVLDLMQAGLDIRETQNNRTDRAQIGTPSISGSRPSNNEAFRQKLMEIRSKAEGTLNAQSGNKGVVDNTPFPDRTGKKVNIRK